MQQPPLKYVYCLSNECYDSIYKIGMTEISPRERADQLYDTGVLSPFEVEFYISFIDEKYMKITEKIIHAMLDDYRVNPRREFFRCDIEMIRNIFKSLEKCGGRFCDCNIDDSDSDGSGAGGAGGAGPANESVQGQKKPIRKPEKVFRDGDRLEHIISCGSKIEFTYDANKNKFLFDGIYYTTMNSITEKHYKNKMPHRTHCNNAWKECRVLREGLYVSTYDLAAL